MSQITLTRTDATYRLPIVHRLKFTNLDASDTYFTVSPLENINDINIGYFDCERATGETGGFSAVIQDPNNIIAKDRIRFARVTIELGKTVATLKPFLIGYADIFPDANRTNWEEYRISGPGSKIRASELMLLYRKAADDKNNPAYGIANLIHDAITQRKWRPANDKDIEEITGWIADLVSDGGGIADEINRIKFTVINEVFTTLWDFLERMSAISGAQWDLDYATNFDEVLTMGYPSNFGTGVRIKSTDLIATGDLPEKTAYIYGDTGFVQEDNASSDVGVATRLYTTTVIDQQVISSQMSNRGSNNLVSKALAQQIKIENDQRRITDFSFILSKVGDPQSPKDRINGDFVMDLGDDTPRGRVLATFSIPLGDISTTPKTIFVNDIDVKIRFLQGENKVWLRLFQRSGIKGDPNTDNANTIFWHHNGIFNTAQTTFSAVSSNNGGDYQLKDSMTFSTSQNGPTYCYEIFSKINRLQSRQNPGQAAIIREKEQFIDTSFLQNPDEINFYLSRELARRSKARRTISSMQVTNPNNFLFKPWQSVTFADGRSGESGEFQVQRARYVISALSSSDYPLGAQYCELTLGSLFNAMIGSCSCL